jgi:hypothetical protein
MLHIVNLEEIQSMLLQVPGLIDSLERHDSKFADAVKEWLMQVEQVLISNRLAVAAEIAVLRGVLISAERGVIPPGVVFSERTTRRKIKDASAADVLRKAEELLSNAIRVDAAQLAEGERLTRQIVTVAQRKGLILVTPTVDEHSEMLKAIWRAMIVDPELGPATTHLAGLVGVHDALILLDRMLLSTPV